MMKSLADWLHSTEEGSEDVHQSVLRLARACSSVDMSENDEPKSSWMNFVEFAVSNLFYGEYYNLGKLYDIFGFQKFYRAHSVEKLIVNVSASLDWVLSTLTYVIGKCQWKSNKDTLLSIGNALIELILSFHREEGTVSFMGLTITRDCIICLNHILYHMQINLNKNVSILYIYNELSSIYTQLILEKGQFTIF